VHGLGEHIGRYTQLFELFNEAGLYCAGFDHYGHGKSPGKRGDIIGYKHFNKEIETLISFVEKSMHNLPIILYGHSMGGNIVLHHLLDKHPSVKCAIVSSPWLKSDTKIPAVKKLLSSVMLYLNPSLTVSNELDPNGISSDPAEVKRYIEDTLVHDRISVRLFHQVTEAAGKILSNADKIDVPVLLLHGTSDTFTSHLGSKECADTNPDRIELKLFPGMRHELHHESSRDMVFKTVKTWLNSQIP
jgi:alpha-beta hydrolase superfamily lysophospholipase